MTAISPESVAGAALAAFGVIEVFLRRGESARSWRTTAADRGSTIAIIVAYVAVGAALTIDVGGPRMPVWGQWIGGSIAAAGVVLRVVAFRTLGARYSRTLRVTERQTLVTHGVYRFVRHPGYTSALAIWGGAAVATGSVVAAVAALVVLAAAYRYRIGAEERMLLAAFGDEYRAYCARSWRLLPYLY
jgi:protein-S-isoprenylcysteine O-methyltransferase Ste14